MRGANLQARLEGSRWGRVLISGFVVVTLLAIGVSNLPLGHVQHRAYEVAEPYLNATGLDQRWQIFGPNPRSTAIYLEAHVTRADGSVAVWRPPTRAKLFGAYRDERWLKLVEHAAQPGTSQSWPVLWPAVARFAARAVAGPGSPPVKVELVSVSQREVPPGKGPPYLEPVVTRTYYTLTLDEPE